MSAKLNCALAVNVDGVLSADFLSWQWNSITTFTFSSEMTLKINVFRPPKLHLSNEQAHGLALVSSHALTQARAKLRHKRTSSKNNCTARMMRHIDVFHAHIFPTMMWCQLSREIEWLKGVLAKLWPVAALHSFAQQNSVLKCKVYGMPISVSSAINLQNNFACDASVCTTLQKLAATDTKTHLRN